MSTAKNPPLDTINGIVAAIAGIRADAKRGAKWRQCPAMHGPSRNGTIVFCEHPEGHEGEHKGFRKRWPNASTPSGSAAGDR